jgi:site-specific DNA-methyltransferase (adenine-specific)
MRKRKIITLVFMDQNNTRSLQVSENENMITGAVRKFVYYEEPGIVLLHGDCLEILPLLKDDSVDVVLTDPPYSSGGFTRADRTRKTSDKYIQTCTIKKGIDFSGDSRSQLGWQHWCSLWLALSWKLTKSNGYVLTFTDWRQLVASIFSLESGGYVHRGLIVWNKGRSARSPHTGYFRHQCEYVVWGTKGVSAPCDHGGPFDGIYEHKVKQSDNFHQCGKPTPLMQDLIKIAPPGGIVLDPFGDSGTTAVAAKLTGRKCITIEMDPRSLDKAVERLRGTNA